MYCLSLRHSLRQIHARIGYVTHITLRHYAATHCWLVTLAIDDTLRHTLMRGYIAGALYMALATLRTALSAITPGILRRLRLGYAIILLPLTLPL